MSSGYFEGKKSLSPSKEEEKIREAKQNRTQTREILWVLRSKKYALFFLIVVNIFLGLYFYTSHFTDLNFAWNYLHFKYGQKHKKHQKRQVLWVQKES